MAFDSQELFANLTARERVHGHHSAEGQAIRNLSRALTGWSSASLAGADVIALCAQVVEDWLKRRLQLSPWSATGLNHLISRAAVANLLSPSDGERLQRVASLRSESSQRAFTPADVESVLQTSIEVVERHWS